MWLGGNALLWECAVGLCTTAIPSPTEHVALFDKMWDDNRTTYLLLESCPREVISKAKARA